MPGRTRTARIALSFVLILSACSNVLESTAGKTTDDALYEDAIKAMNVKDYTTALAKFAAMSGGYRAKSRVMENWSYAYAGDCGLDFISYFNQLSSASLGASTLFQYLMNAWTGITVKPASCATAQVKMKELWSTQVPTASQQLFMAVLGLVKIGVYLRARADNAENGGLGNGTVDAAFGGGAGACATATNAHNLDDSDIKEIVSGLSAFILNVAGLTGSLSSSVSTALAPVQAACAALSPSPCGTDDASAVTVAMVDTMRDLLQTGSATPHTKVGIGACMDDTTVTCCP